MTDHESGADQRARREATDPRRSFIVQAPAGSGKTSLLTQRFLRLLAEAERPEEIVAITFTRKAAAEMRHRIVQALAAARQPPPAGASGFDQDLRELGAAALANAERRGWDLERHPSRLHVQTIDGLNHWLARRLPLSARLGIGPVLLDDAGPVYTDSARRFVARLEETGEPATAIARLVRLLDHDATRLEALLSSMLARRELWLPKVLELAESSDARGDMEALLAAAVDTELGRLRERLSGPLAEEAMALLAEAAAASDSGGPLEPLAGAAGLPPADRSARAQWECLGQALLTADGKPRKTVNRNQGFPPERKALKARMVGLLARLSATEDWARQLERVRRLPPATYTEEQWARVAALCEALVPAAAELQTVFAERGQLDHAAVAAAARQALGGPDAPTELSLALEYRIRHVLVDEYQDTSPVQQSLLERLVAGWQPGDGHTLFCVGDPMQSIYGFREADVSLFLEARDRGVGGIPLESVTLGRNFRSCRAVVEWVNSAFARLFPDVEDFERGAVRHAPSLSTREDEAGAGCRVHPLIGKDPGVEAALVADLVEQALAQIRELEAAAARGEAGAGSERTVAVLVRSRAVLPPILQALRERGIDYRGVELEGLAERAAIRDLLALARALLHRGDRTAWLAVLRAPWCGLSMADLHALAAADRDASIPVLVEDPAVLRSLSVAGRSCLERLRGTLERGLDDLGRRPLGSLVRATWLALGGPATLEEPSDLENADACFAVLDALAAETRGLPSAAEIEAAMDRLMASPVGSPGARVQLMTIHKSKGLEFDTVIVPGLSRRTPAADRQLLYWSRVALEPGRRGIVLASRSEAGEARDRDALERWMQSLERERVGFELGRLAYVAATRARRSLHLVGSIGLEWGEEEDTPWIRSPEPGTLLDFFWPAVEADFVQALGRELAAGGLERPAAAVRPRRSAPPLVALPADFVLPEAPPAAVPITPRGPAPAGLPVRPHFDWAGEEAIAVGVVVHAELERLADAGMPPSALPMRPAAWRASLTRLGLPEASTHRALERVEAALSRVAASPHAARLLDPSSLEAASELALSAVLDGRIVNIKVDRTFVDADGRRWIVDWKTSSHEGGGLDGFLASELERYAPQLERYARVMALFDPRPQRVGLYFPLHDAWRELPRHEPSP